VYLPEEQVDADKTKAIINSYGRECLQFPQDIREEEGCKRVISEVVKAWGKIDVLVNNASVMVCKAFFCPLPSSFVLLKHT
jgi:NADP-dependent 3-hydroxy acid dehydrogenase YdfG